MFILLCDAMQKRVVTMSKRDPPQSKNDQSANDAEYKGRKGVAGLSSFCEIDYPVLRRSDLLCRSLMVGHRVLKRDAHSLRRIVDEQVFYFFSVSSLAVFNNSP